MAIPIELKSRPNWVCWNLINEKKIPINAKTGQAASSMDPNTWTDYHSARQRADADSLAGVGFVFDGSGYVGIDLDDSITEGKLSLFAEAIVSACNSYTEISQSGTGIHIIVQGSIPAALKTNKTDTEGNGYDFLEIYDRGRYFAITGNQWLGTPGFIRHADLLGLFPPDRRGEKPGTTISERLALLAEGNRNETLTSLAGTLRNRGLSADAIFALLSPRAKEENFPEEELRGICERIGTKPLPPQATQYGEEDQDTAAFLEKDEAIEWLAEDVLARGSISFLAGLPEAKKTWVAMDLALEAARGGKWLGRVPVKPCRVFYVDQERPAYETRRRFKALLKGKDIVFKDIQGNLVIRPSSTFRMNRDDSYAALRKRLLEGKFDLVIVDSFKTFHTANEIVSQDMQLVLERLKQLRTECGCAFVLIHHEPKKVLNERRENHQEVSMFDAAGTVDLQQTAEHFFNVTTQEENSVVHHTKNSFGTKIAPIVISVKDLLPDKSSIWVGAI